ncbi:MAG TPA: cupin domain-containing protein [Bacteroidia bacterium]|jgi:ribosomal protein L16 Arg81 hydroxylase
MIKKETDPSLEWLISPLSSKEFFNTYWENKVLVLKREQNDYWKELLTLEIIDNAISHLNLKFPEISIVNSNDEIVSGDYLLGDKQIDFLKLYQLFSEGSTIIFNQLQNRILPLSQLCRALEKEFSMPFQTNIYLTPPGAQGFSAHYDTHDVFVIQVAGSKHWRIYDKPVEYPTSSEPFSSSNHNIGSVTQEFVLEAGDIAYIPRGIVHDATTSKDLSLHITLGVMSYTWLNLIGEALLQLSVKNPKVRSALPVGFANPAFNDKSAKASFRELLNALQTDEAIDSALSVFSNKFISSRKPILSRQLSHIKNSRDFDYNLLISRRPNILYRLTEDKGAIIINCHGNTQINFPVNLKEAVVFALETDEYSIMDIPGEIDFELKTVLIRQLIRVGLVQFLP